MRVVIEVVAGPLAGRRFHLMRNQRLEFGSTARADVCVRGDSGVAPQHFALETDVNVCRVSDLSGKAATFVNGTPVESAVVKSGTEIRAGNSRFIIHVEGAADVAPQIVAAKPAKLARAATRRVTEGAYTTIVCDTGLNRYEGNADQLSPADLAASLAAEWPLYLIADNRRLHDDALTKAPESLVIFDWLGPAGAGLSPIILPPGSIDDPLGLIARGWGKDGLVSLFALSLGPQAEQAIRQSVRVGQDRVLGICWPKVLSYLLSHYQPEFVKQLMQPFACILSEDPESAGRWQLYAVQPLEDKLQALGLQPAKPGT